MRKQYYKNVYYDTHNSKMYLWNTNGMQSYDWVPFVFEKVDKKTNIKSIYDDNVEKIEFSTYKHYKSYTKNSKPFENQVPPSIQFLTERYIDNDDYDLPDLHICFVDIETPHNNGFPTPALVPAPICLISIIDEKINRTVFGIGDYNGKQKNNVNYIKCNTEMELLNVFFNWMHREKFDVITGWNISRDTKMNKYGGFDLPYIVRRSIKVFGENGSQHKKLSPINKVYIRESSGSKDGIYDVGIAGISCIDYLGLYKWFSFNNLESFKLDYVAEIELNKHKLDYSEYETMYDFYQQDWDGFVDYCINDSDLVYDLEKKLGYIQLAQMLTCYCGCPMQNYNSSVPLIEGLMLKHYRKNDLCAPILKGGTQKWFPAAYVKEPLVGMHKDVVDLDIASSYPTHIIILNMSLETYFGRIIGFDPTSKFKINLKKGIIQNGGTQHIRDYKTTTGIHEALHKGRPIYKTMVEYTKKQEYPPFILLKENESFDVFDGDKLNAFNNALKRKLLCIAPNGAVFKTKPKGVIAEVEQRTFEERVKQKGLKSKYKNLAKEEPDKSEYWMELSQNRHVLQWAIKILINSMFGVLGVPYSRYHNMHMAEAITSSGRHTIQQCEIFVDELSNTPNNEIKNIINEIKELY